MNDISNAKLARFKEMINNIDKYFLSPRQGGYLSAFFVTNYSKRRMPIEPVIDTIEKYEHNILFKITYESIFDNIIGDYEFNELIRDLHNNSPVTCVSTYENVHGDIMSEFSKMPPSVVAHSLLYWCIFLCAIDKDFYDNELNTISDTAAALDFTPEDVTDWCNAVKYTLKNNGIDGIQNEKFIGKKANTFFIPE